MKIEDHRLIADAGEPFEFIETRNYSDSVTPIYLIMHYTADASLDGAVSWFQNPHAKASAHLVIGRDGKIVQMVPFNKRAWHAGKSNWGQLEDMNRYSIGIELVNAGKLRKHANGNWVNWATRAIPADEVTEATHKGESAPAGWHEYTDVQIEAAAKVAALLNTAYSFQDVLGHDDISPSRKVDPGPLFPMASFRSRVLGRA